MLAPQNTKGITTGITSNDHGQEGDHQHIAHGKRQHVGDERAHQPHIREGEDAQAHVFYRVEAVPADLVVDEDEPAPQCEGHPERFTPQKIRGQDHEPS